ncbi:MAG: VWA domain-containing protein, partial [bacterium]|nr:VWA domain-containing protein [bacterium]
SPEVMAEQMARLHRVTHRLVWVNPLKATPGYQPLAQGMAAALPHVDDFIEGHSLGSLERLAEVLDDDRDSGKPIHSIGALAR